MSDLKGRLFAVADTFRLASRPGMVIIAADCPLRGAPRLETGKWLEFRNPDGSVTRAVVSGIEMLNPPNPDRPFGFSVRPERPDSSIEVAAEVWSL